MLPLLLTLACAGPDERRPRDVLRLDGDVVELAPSDYTQHHATVALAADGRGLAVFQVGSWVVGAPVADGVPGEAVPLSWPADGNHPQVARGVDGFLVASTITGGGLATLRCDGSGQPLADAEVTPGPALYPDLDLTADGDGLLVWSTGPELAIRTFTGDFLDPVDLPLVPAGLDGIGTPTVRADGDGFRVAWSEADVAAGIGRVRVARADVGGTLGEITDAVEIVSTDPDEDPDGRPSIAIGASSWVLVWREGHDDRATAQAWARFYDHDDVTLLEVPLHGDEPARRPAAAATGDLAVIAWEHLVDGVAEISLQAWDLATAEPLGDPVAASVPDGLSHHRPSVAITEVDGVVRGIVTWEGVEVLDPVTERYHLSVFARTFEVRP